MTAVLSCHQVSKSYVQAASTLKVLQGINLTVNKGERIAITGPSGSGKSTLLSLLGGLDEPTDGEVIIAGKNIARLSESEKAQLRNHHLGFVYQFHHLLNEFSALENAAMPLLIRGEKRSIAYKQAKEVLTAVGLESRVDHRPAQLSGGERQRVAIARALVSQPSCVLMDEPTGNLDKETADKVQALLLRLNQEFNISFIIVTHDLSMAADMQRHYRLQQGQLSELEADNACTGE